MPVRVLDASALGALMFVEPDADAVEAVTTGTDLIAPTLLPYEVASVCRKKCSAAPENRERYLKVLSRAAQMGIHYAEIDPSEVVALALDLQITTYDAAYVLLALANEAALVTLDVELAKRAAKVLGPDRVLPRKH